MHDPLIWLERLDVKSIADETDPHLTLPSRHYTRVSSLENVSARIMARYFSPASLERGPGLPVPVIPENIDDMGLLATAIRKYGTDALAWYTPYHYDPDQWGIYIRMDGAQYLQRYLIQANKNAIISRLSIDDSLQLACEILFHHELFHHLDEMAITHIELLQGRSDLFHLLHAHDRGNASRRPFEEGVANAYALYRVPDNLRNLVRGFMDDQPMGYNQYSLYEDQAEKYRAYGRLLEPAHHRHAPCHLLYDEAPSCIDKTKIPLYVVDVPPNNSNDAFLHAAAGIEVTKGFLKALRKRGKSAEKLWGKVQSQMRADLYHPGLHFEKIATDRFTVRLDSKLRVACTILENGIVKATDVGDHGHIYR